MLPSKLVFAHIIGSLRDHEGNGNDNAKLLLFQNFRFRRFLVFRSKLLPFRGSKVVLFDLTTWKPHFWRSVLQIWACKVKLSRFKCFSSKSRYGFEVSLSYRGPHFGLLDDISKVACGNRTWFAEFQKTFWLALPSWFHKLSNITTNIF